MATPSEYCETADVYDAGFPRGALPNPGRVIPEIVPATDIFELDGHGFRADQELLFRAEAGGTIAAPLVEGTTYYAIPVTADTFKVAATAGGAAINITSAGSNVLVSSPLPFTAWIRWASAQVDDMLPAHVVPVEADEDDTYPARIVEVTAILAKVRGLMYTGGGAPGLIEQTIDWADKALERWARSIPIRGAAVPTAAGLATVAATTATDPRDWYPGGDAGVL